MKIRKTMCTRCSCLWVMKEIYLFRDKVPENYKEIGTLSEILSYWDLEWELFQCYMDNNWVKCKWLYDYVEFLKKNPDVENKLRENLKKWYENLRKT